MANHLTTLCTCGDSLWSDIATEVGITGATLVIMYENDVPICGELRVHFDTSTWNVDADGLIYTDSNFEEEAQSWLSGLGIDGDVWYSEQGMQGEDFVSFDVDREFIYAAWGKVPHYMAPLYCLWQKDYDCELPLI